MKAIIPEDVRKRILKDGVGWMRGTRLELELRGCDPKTGNIPAKLQVRNAQGKVLWHTETFQVHERGTIFMCDLNNMFRIT